MDPNRPIHVPPTGPPQDIRPDQSIYASLGRENLFAMCEAFYLKLGQSAIRDMFPPDQAGLVAASKKQAMFLAGVLGGPPLYVEIIGPPRMRARHIPFVIDEAARQEWLRCFKDVLVTAPADYGFPAEHMDGFVGFLEGFSAWMVNHKKDSA